MRNDVRTLGAIALATSPLLLLQYLLLRSGHLPGGEFGRGDAVIGLAYLCGFFATLLGLRKAGITGVSRGARVFFAIQTGLLLLSAVQEGVELAQMNTTSRLFGWADAAWPLSHMSMLGTGLAVLAARRWTAYRACLPFVSGMAVPALIAIQPVLGKDVARLAFALMTTAGFGLLGYALRSARETRSLAAS